MAVLNVKKVPDKLYRALRRRAEQDHRSIAQEVLHALSQYLQIPARHSIMELQGLGKELWKGIRVDRYLKAERDAWR